MIRLEAHGRQHRSRARLWFDFVFGGTWTIVYAGLAHRHPHGAMHIYDLVLLTLSLTICFLTPFRFARLDRDRRTLRSLTQSMQRRGD